MTERNLENTTSETDETEPDLNLSVEKYKKYFDILRRNDAPMGSHLLSNLEMIAECAKPKLTGFEDMLFVNYMPILENEKCTLVARQNMHELVARMRGCSNPRHTMIEGGRACVTVYMPTDNKADALNEALNGLLRKLKNLIESWMIIKNIYDGIKLDEQDENTGKAILEENKLLINQLHTILMSALEKILQDPKSPINFPQEIYDLRNRILENSETYGNLPAVRTYEQIGRVGTIYTKAADYINREDWFAAGKPTPKEWFDKWVKPREDGVE